MQIHGQAAADTDTDTSTDTDTTRVYSRGIIFRISLFFSPTANVDNLKHEMQKYRTHTHAQDPIQGPPTQMK